MLFPVACRFSFRAIPGSFHFHGCNTIGTVPFVRLTNTTLRYAIALADKGWQQACKDDSPLAKGLNIIEDKVAYKAVADVFGLEYHPYLG